MRKQQAGGNWLGIAYSGPAINIRSNIRSIILTWSILAREKGIIRMIGAIQFSDVIGLSIAFIYRKEVKTKQEEQMNFEAQPAKGPISQTIFHFFTLVLIMASITGLVYGTFF